jgi:hypothetical protein
LRIFGPKREQRAGGWRRLHNVECHIFDASPSVIRVIKSSKMRWAWNVARMGQIINVYNIFDRKPEGKRPLGRPRDLGVGGIIILE